MSQERKESLSSNLNTPAEYVKAHHQNPKKLVPFCLNLLKEKQANGVACALNLLTKVQRRNVIEYFKKNEPLLAAYYSSDREWPVKEYQELLEKPEATTPPALIHALKVKLVLHDIEIATRKLVDHESYNFMIASEKIAEAVEPLNAKLTALLSESSLHLNLRGAHFMTLSDKLNLIACDLSQSVFFMCNLNNSNLSHSDLSFSRIQYSRFVHCNLANVTLRNGKLKFNDVSHSSFNSANLQKTNLAYAGKGYEGVDFRNANLEQTKEVSRSLESEIINIIKLECLGIGRYDSKSCGILFESLINNQNFNIENITLKDSLALLWLMGAEDSKELESRVKSLNKTEISDFSTSLQETIKLFKKSLFNQQGFFQAPSPTHQTATTAVKKAEIKKM